MRRIYIPFQPCFVGIKILFCVKSEKGVRGVKSKVTKERVVLGRYQM
jgi:hypothetical protein